ncbi:MAG: ferritin [Bacteroidetes bacterium]|nr:ferritin [Bacteroidota bacterium]
MLKEKVQKSLNQQMNAEFYSSYLYLAMSAYFESDNFSGIAKWMKIQSQEEYSHAMKFYNYLLQAAGKINLSLIEAPKVGWNSAEEVFQDTVKHEQKITKSIYDLVDLAAEEKDHATNIFLQWFVTEQVEEEATAMKILDRIKLIGENKNGLFYLDHELGKRGASN